MRLRVAVVGAGFMGRLHARVVSESPLAQLTAIVDVNLGAAEALASTFGVAASSSLESLDADRNVDAAIVAVSDTVHEEPTCRLLEAGKAVLLEKPMAHTLEAALHIADTVQTSGGRLMVGHLLRFDPRYVQAAERVADGAIGSPLHVTARRFTYRNTGVRLAGSSSPRFYLGIHDIDAMQWVSGKRITNVFALAVGASPPDRSRQSGEDAIFATCQLEDGAAGNLQFGWTLPDQSPSGIDAQLEVTGTLGYVDVDTHDHGLRVMSPAGLTFPDALHWPESNQRMVGDLADEVHHFLAAVAGDREFVVPVADAVRNVAVNDAINRSIQSKTFEAVKESELLR